jgi:hypothetical protein
MLCIPLQCLVIFGEYVHLLSQGLRALSVDQHRKFATRVDFGLAQPSKKHSEPVFEALIDSFWSLDSNRAFQSPIDLSTVSLVRGDLLGDDGFLIKLFTPVHSFALDFRRIGKQRAEKLKGFALLIHSVPSRTAKFLRRALQEIAGSRASF